MLALIRRLRLAWWVLGLRLRLQRHGMRVQLVLGTNLRVAGRPRLDVVPDQAGRGGTLTIAVGSDVRIGREAVLDVQPGGDHVLELGSGTVFQDHVRIQLRGGAIRLADHAQVRDYCELKSAGELALGRHAICGRACTLHCEQAITLGARVGLAERVTIIDSDHAADGSDTWFMDQPLLVEPVELGENAFVGANAAVLRGARVGANSVVAAGAVVVAGEYPPGWLVGGVPAKPLKSLGG